MQTRFEYLFGPVPSRRFGLSLGIDLTPFKTCSLNCVFCQLGHTTDKTVKREEYVPMDAVLAELETWLNSGAKTDYITLSGSGEPTLHSRFGEVLQYIRQHTNIPGVLLTNASLLYLPEVRRAAAKAEIVKVSLSAWDDGSYQWINRPHPELKFSRLVEGMKTFRAQFNGQLWMEVFLIGGMNSIPADVSKIAALAREISPDRIHLNTSVRPPADDFVMAVPPQKMNALATLFDPHAEVIADFNSANNRNININAENLLTLLRRRPCTAEQMAQCFGMHLNELAKYTGQLLRNRQIQRIRQGDVEYFRIINETQAIKL